MNQNAYGVEHSAATSTGHAKSSPFEMSGAPAPRLSAPRISVPGIGGLPGQQITTHSSFTMYESVNGQPWQVTHHESSGAGMASGAPIPVHHLAQQAGYPGAPQHGAPAGPMHGGPMHGGPMHGGPMGQMQGGYPMQQPGQQWGGPPQQHGFQQPQQELEGMLLKRGPNYGSDWKERHCRLDHGRGVLVYSHKGVQKGEVFLQNATVFPCNAKIASSEAREVAKKRPNSFIIKVPQREFMFDAGDPQKAQMWMSAVARVCGGLKV